MRRGLVVPVGGLLPTGAVIDGEVEDYQVLIRQRRPATNIVITNITVTSLVIGGMAKQVATIDWSAEPGIIYQLEAVTNLFGAPTNSLFWAEVGDVVIGPAHTRSETNAPQAERYYRVKAPYTWP